MFCTTIIPTIKRPSLNRAVRSILDQDFKHSDFEIIVVNDSGDELPGYEWQTSERVRVITTYHRERCIARNVGAALARGKYLHFLDDDDWLLPGALDAFWKMSQIYTDCVWFYGGTRLYDRAGQPLIKLIHHLPQNCFTQVMAGEWIPLQASLIRQDCFHKVGGFNPLINGNEDIDLARKLALHFNFQRVDDLVAGVEMGQEGSTTNQVTLRSYGQLTRESILNEFGTFERMYASAFNNYWRGRIVRVYLTSSVWNLLNRKFLIAISRIFYGLLALSMFTFISLFSRDFWRALTGPYKSETFLRGEREHQKTVTTSSE